MAKAKLAEVTEKWIDGKTEKQHSIKTERQNDNISRVKQTLYISKEATKLLWLKRAETGQPISRTVEKLVMENLGKNSNRS